MKVLLSKNEIAVLEIIANSENPVGSWFLTERLQEDGINISSATAGRILNKLEKMDYVEKIKFKGRIITQDGLDALSKFKTIEEINFYKNKLDDLIDTEILDNYLMVIQARKAIERETARLAAVNITDEELSTLETMVSNQEIKKKNKESITKLDIEFHRLIAVASRNTVLESLYNILSTLGQQSDLFQHLRNRVNEPYKSGHRDILIGIKERDPDLAEKYMIKHFDVLLEDLSKYWHLFK